VPNAFRFLVKAPMSITGHYLRSVICEFSDSPYFLDADYAINEFVAPCISGLGANCGPLVLQCPPWGCAIASNTDPIVKRFYRLLKALPQGVLYAVEIRDPELLAERFLTCLDTTGVRFRIARHARLPTPREQIERLQLMGANPFVAHSSQIYTKVLEKSHGNATYRRCSRICSGHCFDRLRERFVD
jgi:uncharacterized protein YecE (DUF72 family)